MWLFLIHWLLVGLEALHVVQLEILQMVLVLWGSLVNGMK